jgi:hypothetical protein
MIGHRFFPNNRFAPVQQSAKINFYAIGIGVCLGDSIGAKMINFVSVIGRRGIAFLFRLAAIC